MTRFHCLSCGDLTPANDPFPWIPGGVAHGHRAGCPGGRVIPIATLCSEPTTIDESDLAPGMVVVAMDDCGTASEAFLCSPGVVMYDDMNGLVMAKRMRYLDEVDGLVVRRVAGDPC